MSEKEINDLIQTGELAKQDIDDELMEAAEAHAEAQVANLEEEKKKRKKTLIKLGAMLTLTVLILVFTTIAWFTMSREVEGGSLAMITETLPYSIEPLSGGNNIYQEYHDEVMSGDSLIWSMTSTDNMNNNNENADKGIKPGHFGKVSFYVKPSHESIDLDLTFEIVGYSCVETTDEETGDTEISMTRVSDEYQKYLAGHIYLFANRTAITDPDTNVITGYTYSDPIVSGPDLKKALLDQTYYKANENVPVTIYWIWPQTLSTLIDARINSNVSIEPISSGTDRKKIVTNISSYPSYYFYNYSDTPGVTLTESIMATEYDFYCDKYDSADNAIGTNVNYITLKMTTEESSEGA